MFTSEDHEKFRTLRTWPPCPPDRQAHPGRKVADRDCPCFVDSLI